MTEYGILLALIVVGVVAVLVLLGPKIIAAFSFVNSRLYGGRATPAAHSLARFRPERR